MTDTERAKWDAMTDDERWEVHKNVRADRARQKLAADLLAYKFEGTDNIERAEKEMGFQANTRINLLGEPMVPTLRESERQYQRHVAIEWEGGVLWLNMFDFASESYMGTSPHYCIDVRQFNSAGKVKGEGVFTMDREHGRGTIPDNADGNVKGHNWNGGFLVSILTDPDGEETHTDDERS
jgi:hypothetical protein